MRPNKTFSDLIGSIYDCALDAGRWPSALQKITEALGGVKADLIVADPLKREHKVAAHYNWEDEQVELTIAHASLNPTLPLGLTVPLCQVLCGSRDLDLQAFHRSLYWQKCHAGRGIYDYVASAVARTVTTFSSWGVNSSEAKGPFTDDEIELAGLLSPHIRRAVEISGVIGRQKVETGALRGALDALASPALIIEPDGTILFHNRAADRELASRKLLHENGSRLAAVTPNARKLLTNLSSAAVRRLNKGLDAFLTDAAGRTLHVTWAELEQAGEEVGSPILLLLREPEAALTTPLSSAAALYRLTTAETQVLGQVLHGHALADVADILGLARSTVKTHLDAIYRKTQTNRQSELVARIMLLASPLSR